MNGYSPSLLSPSHDGPSARISYVHSQLVRKICRQLRINTEDNWKDKVRHSIRKSNYLNTVRDTAPEISVFSTQLRLVVQTIWNESTPTSIDKYY